MNSCLCRKNILVFALFLTFSFIGFFVIGFGLGCIETQEADGDEIVPENVAYMILIPASILLVVGSPATFFLRNKIDDMGISIIIGLSFGVGLYALLVLIFEKHCL